MLLKKIKLKNIRSYENQELIFPEGSVLLSGDIGSGKSTILLAVEFALFGIEKGYTEGASLLRSGTKEGSVELHFSIEDKDIIIKRSLKRSKNSINQSDALININGNENRLSVTEAKSKILEILNYPRQFTIKKNPIYRFTVYTPQEEMKTILFSDSETRMETLRKVFDVDKYKRIKDSCELFIEKLKENMKEKEGFLKDLEFKKEQKNKKIKEINKIEKQLSEILPEFERIKRELFEKKQELENFEEKITKMRKEKEKLARKEAEIKEKTLQIENIREEKTFLKQKLMRLKKEVEKPREKDIDIREKRNKAEKFLNEAREEDRRIDNKINRLIEKRNSQIEDLQTITNLNFCPKCKQIVNEEHKKKIKKELEESIKKINEELEILREKKNKKQAEINKLEKNIKEFIEKEKNYEIFLRDKKEYEAEMERYKNLIMGEDSLSRKIIKIEQEIKILKERISEIFDLEKKVLEIKKEFDIILEKDKRVSMEKSAFEARKKDIEKDIEELENEIKEKEKVKKNLEYLKKFREWLNKKFILLIDLMEKQFMLKLNAEFNTLFKNWFSMLVEDENLETRVDFSFNPVIEQNGYEINYKYLSGGEKTALALAYRLALNQVINTVLSNINTRDLLILDEPTDGFSTKQLDKIRDVLSELNFKQIILVSHEPKIESFVEHIIKFKKENNVTRIEQ